MGGTAISAPPYPSPLTDVPQSDATGCFQVFLATNATPLPLAQGGRMRGGLYTSAQNLERNYKNWKELTKFYAEGSILSHIAIHDSRFQRHNQDRVEG